MTLHLVRFDPVMLSAARWFAAEGLTPNQDDDQGYAWHALMTAAFGKDMAPKPFRVLERRGRPTQLLAYAAFDAAVLKEQAGEIADPIVVTALGIEAIESKLMPSFAADRRLGFSVRLRPTVRSDRDGDRNKSCERDVFVVARDKAALGEKVDKASAYAEWTRERFGAAGVEIEKLRIVGLESVRVTRRSRSQLTQRGLHSISATR